MIQRDRYILAVGVLSLVLFAGIKTYISKEVSGLPTYAFLGNGRRLELRRFCENIIKYHDQQEPCQDNYDESSSLNVRIEIACSDGEFAGENIKIDIKASLFDSELMGLFTTFGCNVQETLADQPVTHTESVNELEVAYGINRTDKDLQDVLECSQTGQKLSSPLVEADYIKMTENCSTFRSSRGYRSSPGSRLEKEFPLAFLIKAYRDVEQIERLLRSVYWPQNYYCIHLDKKTPTVLYAAVLSIASCFDNVFLSTQRANVVWGGWTAVQADLYCMKDLLETDENQASSKRWKYLINLTGEEFPLLTNTELVRIMKQLGGRNWIPIKPYPSWFLKRVKFKSIYFAPTRRFITSRRPHAYPPPGNITLCFGDVAGFFSRQFLTWLHNPSNKLIQDYRAWAIETVIPDEFYWQSLHCSAPITKAPGGYYGPIDTSLLNEYTITREKWWVHWPEPPRCRSSYIHDICILGIEDVKLLLVRTVFKGAGVRPFVNKLHLTKHRSAYDCLESYMLERQSAALGFWNSEELKEDLEQRLCIKNAKAVP